MYGLRLQQTFRMFLKIDLYPRKPQVVIHRICSLSKLRTCAFCGLNFQKPWRTLRVPLTFIDLLHVWKIKIEDGACTNAYYIVYAVFRAYITRAVLKGISIFDPKMPVLTKCLQGVEEDNGNIKATVVICIPRFYTKWVWLFFFFR